MIPILYSADETRYVTNGIGRLSDCISCTVTEERNGVYELEFDYPITGEHFDEIKLGRIVAVTHDDKGDIQPFIVYARTVPDLRGVVTFNAHHISYKLNEVVVMPYSAGSVAAALEGIVTHSVGANPFTFWTDKTTVGNFENTAPRNARNMLGGEENSILDVFGAGDYEFDNFEVKLHAHRGVDSDVEIRYSKNLVDLTQRIDESGSYNAIVPYWADTEGNIVTLPEEMLIYAGLEPQIAYLTDHNLIIIRTETDEPIEVAYTQVKAAPMDLSDAFEEIPTVEQLRNAARARFEASNAWIPSENLEIDFVQMWQTEEFKEYSALQRVSLCDTVSVYYEAVGIVKVKQRVIKTIYNVLLDRYDKIELGTPQTTLGQAIKADVMQEVPTTSMMDNAIKHATDMIRGGLGGYVVMTPGPNGYPQEILIMDTPDVNTAVNVWRFNQGGLGHSSNGYQGPFSDIALTQDGKINASMITTGVLNANIIKAGVLSDYNNNTTFNLSTGVLDVKKGSINLGNGKFTVNDNGYLTATSGEIAGLSITQDSIVKETSTIYLKISEDGLISGEDVYGQKYGVALSAGDVCFYKKSSWSEMVGTPGASIGYDGTTVIISNGFDWGATQQVQIGRYKVYIAGDFEVSGTKNRRVKTNSFNERLLYCYETPTPLFGDIGEAIIDEDGLCYIDIDDIFSETVAERVEYQVFLQKEGEGDCFVSEKTPRYFVIEGTPNLKVAWELKAKQKDYENIRLEQPDNGLDEYENILDDTLSLESYISDQEALLYGYN